MTVRSLKAELILQNGSRFSGRAFGHLKEAIGEVVFNTSCVGYQETITDPAYAGQIVVMTYPLIGNYGINLEDMESAAPKLKGLIVREKCDEPHNWRCEMELDGFLKQHRIMALEGIDTRALTKLLRNNGTMKGIITVRPGEMTQSQVEQKFETPLSRSLVKDCTCTKITTLDGMGSHIGILDLGLKNAFLEQFRKEGFKITLFPAFTDAQTIIDSGVVSLFVSNGPGSPEFIPEVAETVKSLLGKLPMVGIALGYLVIAAAAGCKVTRLKYGHHGSSCPVKDIKKNRVYVTSQNTDYVVSETADDTEVIFKNVYEGTPEGILLKRQHAYGVQFYPDLFKKPWSTRYVFDYMCKLLNGGENIG